MFLVWVCFIVKFLVWYCNLFCCLKDLLCFLLMMIMLGCVIGVKIVECVLIIMFNLFLWDCCYICNCVRLDICECNMLILILKCCLKCLIVCGVNFIFGIKINICWLVFNIGVMICKYIFVLLLLVIFLSKKVWNLVLFWFIFVIVIVCLVEVIGGVFCNVYDV